MSVVKIPAQLDLLLIETDPAVFTLLTVAVLYICHHSFHYGIGLAQHERKICQCHKLGYCQLIPCQIFWPYGIILWWIFCPVSLQKEERTPSMNCLLKVVGQLMSIRQNCGKWRGNTMSVVLLIYPTELSQCLMYTCCTFLYRRRFRH